jgi:hypothetical protein
MKMSKPMSAFAVAPDILSIYEQGEALADVLRTAKKDASAIL